MPGTYNTALGETLGRGQGTADGDEDDTTPFSDPFHNNEQTSNSSDTTAAKPVAAFADTALVITESGSQHEASTHRPIEHVAPL